MKKKSVYLGGRKDGKVELYCELRIIGKVLEAMHHPKLIKKTRRIIELMFRGEYDEDLYAYYPEYGVTAMKWKGGDNIRMYCKEEEGDPKRIIIAKGPHRKKDNKLGNKEISLMESTFEMEFEFLKAF